MNDDIVIISCSGANHIGIESTIKHVSKWFKNGEVYVEIGDAVDNKRVFILQSFSLPNTHLMELMLTIDAAKRAGAKEVNVIIPYFPYCRMDKKHRSGVPISAKVVADMLSTMNIDRVVTFDLHAEQIQGFFSNNIDFCHMKMGGFFKYHMLETYIDFGLSNWTFCAPDAGSVKRTKEFAMLAENQNLVNMIKYRVKDQEVDTMLIIGDVKGKKVVIYDDMIDTCGTIKKACDILYDEGANHIVVLATHGVLSKPAFEVITNLSADVYVTDSIKVKEKEIINNNIDIYKPANLKVLPLYDFIKTIIDRITNYQRLGDLCSTFNM